MSQKIKIMFLTILTLMLINYGNVFATSITIEKIEEIIQEYNTTWTLNERQLTKFKECLTNYKYMSFTKDKRENNLFFIFYNNIPSIGATNVVNFTNCRRLEVNISSPTSIWDDTYSSTNYNFYSSCDWYTESGFYEVGTTTFKAGYEPGSTNMDIDFSTYKKPYFEFSANKIGTTNLENFNENLPCYYQSSFKTYSNSYATFKEIGKLYIDEKYLISDIYTSTPIIKVYNIEQTKKWQYENYLIFTDNTIVNGYRVYDINFDLSYINSPYIYSMELVSQDSTLGSNISINFVILTETTGGRRNRRGIWRPEFVWRFHKRRNYTRRYTKYNRKYF